MEQIYFSIQQISIYKSQYLLSASNISKMTSEQKTELQFDNYWLTVILHSAKLQLTAISISRQASKKFTTELSIHKDMNPLLKAFETCQQIYQLIKAGSNHTFDFQANILTLKWKIVAHQFSKQIKCGIQMKEHNISEVQKLKIENYLLKKKLEKYEKSQIQKKNNKLSKLMCSQHSHEKKTGEEINVAVECLDQSVVIEKQQKNSQKKQNKQKKPRGAPKKLKCEEETGVPATKQKRKGRTKGTVRTNEQPQQGSASQPVHNMVKISFQNGDYYYGEVKDNLYHGHGLYYSATNGTFQGQWKQGKANGYGVSKDPSGNQHTGFYVNDKRSGKGIDIYPNGERYQGEFEQDAKSGKGKYFYANGDTYQGQWKNDLYHGSGRQNYHDGSAFEGTWVCDEKDGAGLFIGTDGKKFRQIWDKGSKIREEQVKVL